MVQKLSPGLFHGQILRKRDIAAFTLSESAYLPETRLPKHSHERSYFCFLLHGTYTESYGNKMRECRPSTVVFHPPDEAHANHFLNEGGRLFRFELDHDWLKSVRERSGALTDPADQTGGALAWLTMKLYTEFRHPDHATPLAIEGLVLEIVAQLARQKTMSSERQPPRWLGVALEFIRAHFEMDLELRSIAASAGVHPVHLARVFRRFNGCTVGDYLRRLRIESASRRLAASDAPLTEVALRCGFADQSHFSKSFKAATGWTPAQYRATFRPR
jgi:AraC family transcriptional regulator